jgi:tetratricopeptide (TPR) repeat protein/tRNA A-37 threonylcarbamoyl transferase component Bud32
MISPGDKVKHYEIIKSIGKGGMGEVYLARDTVLDREVAIKFLPEEMQKDVRARERFLREAKSAAALDHPFICQIYETGELEGKAFIAMEYVEGENLSQKMAEGLLPLRDALQTTLEIAEALEVAHKKGIVHRDLKPANIMLTVQGHAKVMDFGLAKQIVTGEESITKTLTQTSLTQKGTVVGTIAYMSPEQARGDEVDGRSDIFALGIILHEMISGKNPFSKPTPVETLTSILRDIPPSANVKPKMINPLLNPILRKALAKEPEKRYQTIKELIVDLRKAQKEITGGIRLLYRRLPLIAGAAVIIIALLVVAILRFTHPGAVSKPATGPPPISVLIADFENKTGDPAFDGSLEPALRVYLEGAPFISVYQSAKARGIATQIDPNSKGQLKPQIAQSVGQREGINVVVNGVVESNGAAYTVKMWAVDVATSKNISEPLQKIKTKTEILKAADGLAAKLRSDLGEVPTESAKTLAKETFTTASPEAWKAYNQAQEFAFLTKNDEAIEQYLRAIKEDPDFGRAYAGLGVIYANLSQFQEAEKYYQMAMARIDRMSDREKYRTLGGYYLMKQNHLKAIEEYSALVTKFPVDSAGHSMLAYAYFLGRNMAKAVEEGKYGANLDPKKVTSQINLAWYAIAAGDLELGEQQAKKVLELNPSFVKGYVCQALSELGQDRSVEAVQIYEKLKNVSPLGASFAATGLADIALYEGRLTDAVAILKEGIKADMSQGTKFQYYAAFKWATLAEALFLQRQKAQALDAAGRAVSLSKKEEILFLAAQIYLNAGQENKALDLAKELSNQLPPVSHAYAMLIEGEKNMTRGDINGAIKLFREAQAQVDTWLGRFALGRACLEAKAFTDAYSEFEECLKRYGEAIVIFLNDIPSYHYFPPIHYYLGRAQEGLGSPAAAESYKTFLRIKEKNDETDPLIEDARRRLKNL